MPLLQVNGVEKGGESPTAEVEAVAAPVETVAQ